MKTSDNQIEYNGEKVIVIQFVDNKIAYLHTEKGSYHFTWSKKESVYFVNQGYEGNHIWLDYCRPQEQAKVIDEFSKTGTPQQIELPCSIEELSKYLDDSWQSETEPHWCAVCEDYYVIEGASSDCKHIYYFWYEGCWVGSGYSEISESEIREFLIIELGSLLVSQLNYISKSINSRLAGGKDTNSPAFYESINSEKLRLWLLSLDNK